MSGLIARRLFFSLFMTFILAFSIQGIADPLMPDAAVLPTPETPSIAAVYDIAISEIMYTTNTDKLPQWIELHNRSAREVSLDGWEVTIENHPEDTTVLATTLTFTLGAEILNANQTVLLVTERGQHAGVEEAKGDLRADNIVILKDLFEGRQGYRLLSQTAFGNLRSDNIALLKDLLKDTKNYRLLSQTAFKVILKAPARAKTGRKMLSDIAGNLGAIPKWKLPLIESKRSSIIREYDSNHPYDGTRTDGWELASKKDHQYIPHIAYYGHHTDYGTPGYRVYGPLPVSLSSFRPVRDKATGEIVVRWVTTSELNNAGFNILRNNRKDGGFKVINVKGLIAGRGTTNEPHEYVFTDTTAKRNVVYSYRIECVSLDGKHTTLRTTHLRGLVVDYLLKGYRAPAPLPVSLSSFCPLRDRSLGNVVVTWTTESEMNNAGFNILRSNRKDDGFKVINVKGLIAEHGTTNQRYKYTFTDTAATHNVLYFSRIECVSLDGKHTTLRTTPLIGDIDYRLKLFRHLEQFWWRFE